MAQSHTGTLVSDPSEIALALLFEKNKVVHDGDDLKALLNPEHRLLHGGRGNPSQDPLFFAGCQNPVKGPVHFGMMQILGMA